MTWETFISEQEEMQYYFTLTSKLNHELDHYTVYPPKDDWFRAFELTPFDETKVVIIGQDPYHQPNQAMGLAFSVNPKVKIPKSLRNIYAELLNDLYILNTTGSLEAWARQGVLLLNTTLTVRHNEPNSHSKIGWEIFTTNAIETLAKHKKNLVFILWGNHAQQFEAIARAHNHHVIKSAHPSPLSAYRGFFTSYPFSRTNKILEQHNLKPINWQVY